MIMTTRKRHTPEQVVRKSHLQSGAMKPPGGASSRPEQVEVVRRALHPQPAHRFRNAAALRDALEATP